MVLVFFNVLREMFINGVSVSEAHKPNSVTSDDNANSVIICNLNSVMHFIFFEFNEKLNL